MEVVPARLACVSVIAFTLVSAGCYRREASSDTDKRACAEIIQRAVAASRSRDEAQELVRADPQARRVCAGLEMNGVPVIP
jgi:hypothetical protein